MRRSLSSARLGVLLIYLATLALNASAAEVVSTPEQREEVALTIYNQNFGLVRELRRVELGRGSLQLEFGGVASTIQPETVHIQSLSAPGGLRVLEQNYRYDLLSPQKLLEKYVGRMVRVHRWNEKTGREETHDAEVLAVNGGPILRIGDEITFNYPGRFSFPEVPKTLIAKPSLVWLLESERERQTLEVSYLANQLSWRADYVLAIDESDALGDLRGWVTLTNQSGASYENARLKLVAGDVQRMMAAYPAEARRAVLAAVEQEASSQFAEQAFFEYHLYTLQRPATLLTNEQKQVTLLEAPGIEVTKRLIFHGAPGYYRSAFGHGIPEQKVGVYLDIENREQNQLGIPLPKGVLRVYKQDEQGARQFIGEDRIDHTPRDERLRIKLGEAFDVVAERKQTDFSILGHCLSESAWESEIRNHKEEDVEVEVVEPAAGDWKIVRSTHDPIERDAHSFGFEIEVPARESRKIEYRVRVRWC
jgi:hypothetical protein